MRSSKYWDDFERRIVETVNCLRNNLPVPVRRVAVFVTDRCNFRCGYCNSSHKGATMSEETFMDIVHLYEKSAIIHITGGEPSIVPWLYPVIRRYQGVVRFHLNTNCYIVPPSSAVRRLKVSLDTYKRDMWNSMVGVKAFDTVCRNIKQACSETIVSVTCTLSKKNYKDAVEFAKFCQEEFPGLYAIFFSIYKGTDPEYMLSVEDAEEIFTEVVPNLLSVLDMESSALLSETLDEKERLLSGVRFSQNANTSKKCYLAMSERVISPTGQVSACSHLYRDSIFYISPDKHSKCSYGCNRRLVAFNEEVARRLGIY